MASSGESLYHLGFTAGYFEHLPWASAFWVAGVAILGTDLVRLIFGSPGAPER